jgi:serine/threonine-protein kinase
MICPNCQQPLRDGAQFCTSCGARTSHAAAHGPAETTDEQTVVHAEAHPDPLAGRVLDGKYELLARIGQGGMGSVYRARRVHIGDEVAVKLLHAQLVSDESLVERFRREARAAAQLHHPNVVTIHDFGEARGPEGFVYIVMELVRGTSLRELLRREGWLPAARAVSLMRDICAGVGAAHRRGIVHRDLKPDNVIVAPPDEDHDSERVKVVDFGIAKLRDMAAEGTLTQTGAVVGTPFYMSPEQCRGESLDPRSDVYSLSAMLFEMLAGSPPFTASNASGVIIKHVSEPPPPLPADLNVPSALREAVARALSKEPAARQQDAAEFARDMHAAAVLAARPAAPPKETLFPTDAPPARVVPAPRAVTPAPPPTRRPAAEQDPRGVRPAAPPPPQEPPRRRGSRASLVVGVLVGGLIVLAVFAVAGLVYFNRSRREVASNTNARPPARNTSPSPTPTPTPSPTPTPTPSPTPLSGRQVGEIAAGVGNALKGWAETTQNRDLDGHMAFYADRLDFFYLKPGVPAAQVRSERGRAFDRYDDMQVKLSNLQVVPDPTGTRATATFDKEWEFEGGDRRSKGSVRQQLTLVKTGGHWLITAEKDLQVHYKDSEDY